MPITLNDLKREIDELEKNFGESYDFYDRPLIIGGARLNSLKLRLAQFHSSDYIELDATYDINDVKAW